MRKRRRKWRVKRLAEGALDGESVEQDFDQFLEDLEEDEASRQHVNIYKKTTPPPSCADDDDEETDVPTISIEEMLDDLHIDDEEMPEAATE